MRNRTIAVKILYQAGFFSLAWRSDIEMILYECERMFAPLNPFVGLQPPEFRFPNYRKQIRSAMRPCLALTLLAFLCASLNCLKVSIELV